MTVTDVNEADFEKEVLGSKVPVVIDLWAEWCGPCRVYSPIVDEVAKGYDGKVKFVKVNVDDNEKLAVKYNVMSIPTTLLIVGGKVKAINVGAVPKETLKGWIDKNL
ncbi:MAG: thioredoxin [Candidatus Micrarchaeota archaeon]|nr:thioredoxin [Candidatus Micrarchaeota archaeon]